MSWAKLNVDFFDDPRVMRAGPIASWLYLRTLAHSVKFLTDGFVQHDVVRRFSVVAERKRATAALVRNGLWLKRAGGYQIVGFLDEQRSAADARAQRAGGADRARRWRAERPLPPKNAEKPVDRNAVRTHTEESREEKISPQSPSHAPGPESGAAAPAPGPPPLPRSGSPPRSKRGERIAPDWRPHEETLDALRRELALDDAQLLEHAERFRCDWIARGALRLDWAAVFRSHMRKLKPKPKTVRTPNTMPPLHRATPFVIDLPPLERQRLAKDMRRAVSLDSSEPDDTPPAAADEPEEPCAVLVPPQTFTDLDPAPPPTYELALCAG